MRLFPDKFFTSIAAAAVLIPNLPAQAKTYRNAEYGFSLNFDNRFQGCKDLDWTHEHGVAIYLEHGVCTHGIHRVIVVRGDYNNPDAPSDPTADAQQTCDAIIHDDDPKAQLGQVPPGLQLGRIPSGACRIDHSDGRIYILVEALTGHYLVDTAPYLDYSIQLTTNAKSFDADLTTLRSVLKSVRFFRGNCCNPKKVTDLP